MLSDFVDGMSPERILTTVLSGLVFGFFALGRVMSDPRVAQALGDVRYGTQVAKAVLVVLLVFTVPNVLLSLVGLDGPTGRAIAGVVLSVFLAVTLDVGIRARVRWATRTRWRWHRQRSSPSP